METKNLFELNSFRTNDYEAEQNFRETCSWYESKFFKSDQPPSQAYEKYINNYHKVKSLYLIIKGGSNRTYMHVYDTESEIQEEKLLKAPIGLISKCITLLPNGELFCFYKFSDRNRALIIDNNYDVRLLLSGLSSFNLSAIYFEANIYCFGGVGIFGIRKDLSKKFNLNENRWINLTPMPKADYYCHSVIFNENILICGYYSKKILLYSVYIDSFSIIPYEFLRSRRKILINAERLYLIECFGFIYESGVENEYAWEKISNSIISHDCPNQIYCLYNKEEIYISVESPGERYFKFNLRQKAMVSFNKKKLFDSF